MTNDLAQDRLGLVIGLALIGCVLLITGAVGMAAEHAVRAGEPRERVVSVCNTSLARACACVGTTMRWRSAEIVECVEGAESP